MPSLIPSTFPEALGGIVILLALLLSLISLIPALRSHSFRLLALFFVAALSLFSNHWSTYFAGIFVIATAVTELEFLQNLAAIIRGNKDYFDYKKETLTSEQKQKKVQEEQAELNIQQAKQTPSKELAPEKATVPANREAVSSIRQIINIEDKALDKMEKYYNSKIERGVRISRKGRHIEIDGLIPSAADDMVSEKIIEVKYLRSPQQFTVVNKIFPQLEAVARSYCEITNKIAKLHVVLVIEGDEPLSESQLEKLKQLVDSSNIAMGYSVFTTKQLDLP
jgi:hypothetical protein